MTDVKDDPFATVEETGTTAKKAPAKKKAEPEDANPLAAFIAEMTIDEEDFAAPTPFAGRYIRPAEGSWIPVRITSAKVEQREMRAIVVTTKDGSLITTPKEIDAIDPKGASQEVEQVTLWQFVVEAEHVATCYGERSTAYRLYTPVFPMRIPLNKPRERNGVKEMGFDKISGKKLLAATRVVKPGMKLTESNEELLERLADDMVKDGGKIVMAKVRYRTKKSDDSVMRKNADGTPVKALVDETEGSFIRLEKNGDTFANVSTGEAYDGDTSKLIPFGEGQFLIPDNSDDGVTVRDIVKREAVYDNLADDVYGVPGRSITIQRLDETEIEAEVTWDTVGFITVPPIKAGTVVQAVAGDETITAAWLGAHWEEVEPHNLEVTEDGKVTLIAASVAASAATASSSGLDVFKGDAF